MKYFYLITVLFSPFICIFFEVYLLTLHICPNDNPGILFLTAPQPVNVPTTHQCAEYCYDYLIFHRFSLTYHRFHIFNNALFAFPFHQTKPYLPHSISSHYFLSFIYILPLLLCPCNSLESAATRSSQIKTPIPLASFTFLTVANKSLKKASPVLPACCRDILLFSHVP